MTRRRASHVDVAVSYAAVGASQDPNVLRYPPEGTTPFADEVRLGSGPERFVAATSALMTWGAQRGAGVRVEQIDEGTGAQYAGLSYGDDGEVLAGIDRDEAQYSPSGERFITAGMSATLDWPDKREPRRVRVVYVIEEPNRAGFALGTLDSAGAIGEQLFCVERREDGSVWATVRGFLVAPEGGLLGIKGKAQIKQAQAGAAEQLRALLPVRMVADAAEPVVGDAVTGDAESGDAEAVGAEAGDAAGGDRDAAAAGAAGADEDRA